MPRLLLPLRAKKVIGKKMRSSRVDVLIIGAGPAGLSAAIELKKSGIKEVRVIEREQQAGGIPRHSYHPGYGIRDLRKFYLGQGMPSFMLSGPKDLALRSQLRPPLPIGLIKIQLN